LLKFLLANRIEEVLKNHSFGALQLEEEGQKGYLKASEMKVVVWDGSQDENTGHFCRQSLFLFILLLYK
jgi:hypothetical protein